MLEWPVWVAGLWWGSLTTLGFAVVPLLFVHLPSAALAGNLAAKLFGFQTWVSLSLGAALLIGTRANGFPVGTARRQTATIFITGGLLLALLIEFAAAPHIVARDNVKVWHSVASAMFFLQWLCAVATFRTMMKFGVRTQV